MAVYQRLSWLYRFDLFVVAYLIAFGDFQQKVVLNINHKLIKDAWYELKVLGQAISGKIRRELGRREQDIEDKHFDINKIYVGSDFEVFVGWYILEGLRDVAELKFFLCEDRLQTRVVSMSAEVIYNLCEFPILFSKDCPFFDGFEHSYDQFSDRHHFLVLYFFAIIFFNFKANLSFADENAEERRK